MKNLEPIVCVLEFETQKRTHILNLLIFTVCFLVFQQLHVELPNNLYLDLVSLLMMFGIVNQIKLIRNNKTKNTNTGESTNTGFFMFLKNVYKEVLIMISICLSLYFILHDLSFSIFIFQIFVISLILILYFLSNDEETTQHT